MQNIEKAAPSIFIDLGGVERRFGFTMWSFGQIKRLTGKNPLEQGLNANDPDELAILVWAGLIPSDPTLDGEIVTAESAGVPGTCDQTIKAALQNIQKWLSLDKLPAIGQAVRQAFEAATPPKKK